MQTSRITFSQQTHVDESHKVLTADTTMNLVVKMLSAFTVIPIVLFYFYNFDG